MRHGECLRESGDARGEVLEEGEGKLMLLGIRDFRERDGRVMDSVAGGAYGDRPPGGWRLALRKRIRPRVVLRKVSWGRHGDLFFNWGTAL